MKVFPFTGCKDILHAGLRIIEVPPDGAHPDVAALLCHHLCLLHRRHTPGGIEHHDPGAGHIMETLQRRLTGIAGGGGKDHHIPGPLLPGGGAHQPGQHRQGHVLEGAGGPVVQLQHIPLSHRHQRRQVIAGEFSGIAGPHQPVHILKVRQQHTQNVRRHGHGILLQGPLPVKIQLPRIADIQSSVRCDAL